MNLQAWSLIIGFFKFLPARFTIGVHKLLRYYPTQFKAKPKKIG